ncbi:MAG: hypothetical protein QW434_09695 [Pyrobaculum sp.]
MIFSKERRRDALACVCEYVKSICNSVIEERRWDRRVFYEDVAAAAGIAVGFIYIIAVVLAASAVPPEIRKAVLTFYVIFVAIEMPFHAWRPDVVIALNPAIRVASCGLPAKYLAGTIVYDALDGIYIPMLFMIAKLLQLLGFAGFVINVVILLLFLYLGLIAYFPTLHCLKSEHAEAVKERCGKDALGELYGYFHLDFIPRATRCCKEARVWLYRNVAEARRAAVIYQGTRLGLKAVAIAYALYVLLYG